MSNGPSVAKRPGGLTALAVLNFVFGGLGAIGFLFIAAFIGDLEKATRDLPGRPSAGIIYLSVLLSGITVALLITSGVGYLKQKKFLGKTMGNIYAILSLAHTGLDLAAVSQSFGIFTIIGLIYPVLTLILLNTVFKDDFPNP